MRTGRSTMDTRPFAGARFAAYVDNARRERILVGEVDGDAVGWGIVKRYSDRPGYRYACETSVYVTESQQGRGYGTEVMHAVIDMARSLDYHHLVAKILAVNEESVRFHERLGFEVVGRQRAIGFLKGEWKDVVILQLVLDEPESSPEVGEVSDR